MASKRRRRRLRSARLKKRRYVPESYTAIQKEFDMYYLTVENLTQAMKKLIAAR